MSDLPSYGACDCGGTFVLDLDSLPEDGETSGMVEFPCDDEDCDWSASMSPQAFELSVEASEDHTLEDLRAKAAAGEVAA